MHNIELDKLELNDLFISIVRCNFSDCYRTGFKIGVVGAVLKFSYDCDIWSLDSNKGAQKLKALKETVIPGTIIIPYKEKCSEFEAGWNNAMDKIFSLVSWPVS
ncbi:unnamed protein product [Thelazia callipaeda]|uniref:TIR domain-containing protein n=1 Tax=Thelazia callipaeda TaxID=103827 RepID=A0A0N5D646_THECL|nr:unnamed protein product [Thelazia callipaeda]